MERSRVRRSFGCGESSELSESSVRSCFIVVDGNRMDIEVAEKLAVSVVGDFSGVIEDEIAAGIIDGEAGV